MATETNKKTEDVFVKNRIKFEENHYEELFKAEEVKRSFDKTLILNVHKRCFYREIADIKIMILTANEMERRTLFACFTDFPSDADLVEKNVIKRIPYGGLVYSIFYINDIKVVHVEPEMTGSNTIGGTEETLRKALKKVRPTYVVSLGVGFGFDADKESLCDVMVGRQFFSYDKSTKIKDNELNVKRLHVHESDKTLLSKAKSTLMYEDKTKGLFDNLFNTHIGNLLTGEFVIDSKMYHDMISHPFKPFGVIGGEMESYGMFSAIEEYNKQFWHLNTHGIMIKGISDWGAGKNVAASKKDDEEKPESTDNIPNVEELKEDYQTQEDNEFKEYNSNERLKQYMQLSSEDRKNNLQVLSMCNTCTVCKMFLKESSLFSDYRIHGLRKNWRRFVNLLFRPLRRKMMY